VTFTNGNASFFPISELERVAERAFTVGNEYYRNGYRASAPGRRYYNVREHIRTVMAAENTKKSIYA